MIRRYAAITVLALALGLSAAQAATWYVAVNGDDQWSGSVAYGVDSLLTELGIEAVDASGAGPGR